MKMKLKKLLPLAGALFITTFTSAFANSNYSSNGNYGSATDSTSTQSGQQGAYQRGTFREITPNAGPRVAHGADVFITANFIWWKATQDGLRYATSGFGTDTTSGKTKSVGEDWAPGFKVGLGLNLSHDGWDLYAQYTWLHSSERNSIEAQQITPIFNVNETGQLITNKGRGKWNLHFNVVDLELGRNFYLSQFLTMRPFIGLKGTWQDQDTRFRFVNTANENDFYRIHGDVDTWGVGVRGGFNLSYYIAKRWSIFGNFAWTTMWANYHELERKDRESIADVVSTRVNIKNDNFYTVKYVGEMELGLRWEIWFYDDNYHFAIQAGWEEQVWLNWGQFPAANQQQVEHDLSLHGLNLKFRFDF